LRKAKVLVHDEPAGILSETEGGYEFLYYPEYAASSETGSISLTIFSGKRHPNRTKTEPH